MDVPLGEPSEAGPDLVADAMREATEACAVDGERQEDRTGRHDERAAEDREPVELAGDALHARVLPHLVTRTEAPDQREADADEHDAEDRECRRTVGNRCVRNRHEQPDGGER